MLTLPQIEGDLGKKYLFPTRSGKHIALVFPLLHETRRAERISGISSLAKNTVIARNKLPFVAFRVIGYFKRRLLFLTRDAYPNVPREIFFFAIDHCPNSANWASLSGDENVRWANFYTSVYALGNDEYFLNALKCQVTFLSFD